MNEIRQPAVLFNRHNEHVLDPQPRSDPNRSKVVLNYLKSDFTNCLLFEKVTAAVRIKWKSKTLTLTPLSGGRHI